MLDPETVLWYRTKAQKEIERLTKALRAEQSDESTRLLRARIKVLEDLVTWKQDSHSTDSELSFGL